MESSSSKFMRQFEVRKGTAVRESMLLEELEVFEEDQKMNDEGGFEDIHLNEWFYLQVRLCKTGGEMKKKEVSPAEQFLEGQVSSSFESKKEIGVNVLESQFTIAFILSKDKILDQCDLYESKTTVNKIFKLPKMARPQTNDEDLTEETMQQLFHDLFAVRWTDTHRHCEGYLPLPMLSRSQLRKMFIHPVKVVTNRELLDKENEVQVYGCKYEISFLDVSLLQLSSQLFCQLTMSSAVGSTTATIDDKTTDFHTYFALDGRTKFGIQLNDIISQNRQTAVLKGECKFRVYGHSLKRPFLFTLTIVDKYKRVRYNYSETLLL